MGKYVILIDRVAIEAIQFSTETSFDAGYENRQEGCRFQLKIDY